MLRRPRCPRRHHLERIPVVPDDEGDEVVEGGQNQRLGTIAKVDSVAG